MKPYYFVACALSLGLTLSACQPPANTNNPPAPQPTPSASSTPDTMPTPTPAPTTSPTPEATPTPVAQTQTRFAASLTGSQEVPAVNTDARGSARVYLNPERTQVTVQVTTSGLTGPVTGAHIHSGIAGQNGDVVKALDIKGNVLTATWRTNDNVSPLQAAQIDSLLNGGLYINVHTAANPNGEIRGQITTTTDTVYPVYLSPEQEVPPVMTGATGTANVRVRADNSAVVVEGFAHNLTGEITGAHIHKAAAGANGDVVKPLTVTGNRYAITWTTNDAENPLTPELLADLMAGNLYINVHTSVNPSGEVRGQIMSAAPTNFNAASHFTTELLAGNEVPPVTEDGFGAVELTLDGERDTVTVEAWVSGLTGPITGAHIHRGAPDANGPVVKGLQIDGNKLTATWNRTDTEFPFTTSLLTDLLTGGLYVNVHTDKHEGGEVRGQITSTLNRVYAIPLTGDQEVPRVNTDARSTALVMLAPDHQTITVKGLAHGLSGAITGAHIHMAPEGLSGPVVKPLTVTGTTFSVTWSTTDAAQPLVPSAVQKLMSGEYYINVHTQANPNGEVRGQIK